MDIKENDIVLNKENKNHKVHRTLAHSYFSYFLILLIGISLDLFFPIRIFQNKITLYLGFLFLLFASFIILWAQYSSKDLLKKESVQKEHFSKGPYYYTRAPTHFGLFFLALGFGFILNGFFVIILTLISFIFLRITFVKKQEKLLENKYGDSYMEYKRKVRF